MASGLALVEILMRIELAQGLRRKTIAIQFIELTRSNALNKWLPSVSREIRNPPLSRVFALAVSLFQGGIALA
jgi:hypothetical protein